jgi:O-methyltransferase involved in polyketide biosynthesis
VKDGQSSRTAERVAQRRAAHQVLDEPPVFRDPLAIRIIEPEAAERLRRDPGSFNDSRLAPYLRAAFAVRSRFAEDELARAVEGDAAELNARYFAQRRDGLRVGEMVHIAKAITAPAESSPRLQG